MFHPLLLQISFAASSLSATMTCSHTFLPCCTMIANARFSTFVLSISIPSFRIAKAKSAHQPTFPLLYGLNSSAVCADFRYDYFVVKYVTCIYNHIPQKLSRAFYSNIESDKMNLGVLQRYYNKKIIFKMIHLSDKIFTYYAL